jgi:hypothetical protein
MVDKKSLQGAGQKINYFCELLRAYNIVALSLCQEISFYPLTPFG